MSRRTARSPDGSPVPPPRASAAPRWSRHTSTGTTPRGCSSDCATSKPGDEVAIDRTDGGTAWFVVLATEQYPKDAFPTERVYGDIDHAGLRLITCGGEFDRAARSYRDNVVVYASLVGSPPE